jgi:hypothetical protein
VSIVAPRVAEFQKKFLEQKGLSKKLKHGEVVAFRIVLKILANIHEGAKKVLYSGIFKFYSSET